MSVPMSSNIGDKVACTVHEEEISKLQIKLAKKKKEIKDL